MKELGAIAFEKSLRLPPENPRRKVAEMEGPPKRLKRGNWRDSSTKTITEAKLDNLARQEFQQPLIQHNLITTTFGEELNQKIKRSDDNEAKRKATKEHMASLPQPAVEIYTDGSAQNGTKNGGSGAVIMDKTNNKEYEMCAPAGTYTCSYQAELIAIKIALQKVKELQEQNKILPLNSSNIHLFTDSKSAVQKLKRSNTSNALIHDIHELLDHISNHGNHQILLQWIPSHCGIEGNERVDKIAKKATTLSQETCPIDFDTAKACIKQHIKEDWNQRKKRKHPNTTYVDWQLENDLSAREKVLLSRIRTGGHSPEFAWYRHFLTQNDIEPEMPVCTHCKMADETADHMLAECPAFAEERHRIFQDCDPFQLLYRDPTKIILFMREIGFLKSVQQ